MRESRTATPLGSTFRVYRYVHYRRSIVQQNSNGLRPITILLVSEKMRLNTFLQLTEARDGANNPEGIAGPGVLGFRKRVPVQRRNHLGKRAGGAFL